MAKELLFSLTAKDFVFTYSRGTGAGGQKRNKTESHVRVFHPASGASAECDETRSQHDNKAIAFRKLAESATFKKWHHLEVARRTGALAEMEERVNREMRVNTKVEAKDENGRWVNWDERVKDE